MDKKYIYILILLGLLFTSINKSYAQTLRTGYFDDHFTMRYKINPAFAPDQGYIGLIGVSSISANINSNLSLDQLVYKLPNGEGTCSFLHPSVSSEKFMNTLKANNYLNSDLEYDLLNVGFYIGDVSFISFDIGIKEISSLNIPKDFFGIFKEGMINDPSIYDISDLNFSSSSYLQFGIRYSRDLDELISGLRFGVRAKFLQGLNYMSAKFNKAQITMSSDTWITETDAILTGYGKGLKFKLNDDGEVEGFDYDSDEAGLSGSGVALDFGLSYTVSAGSILDGLQVSASITDLGKIKYNSDNRISARANGSVTHNGFDNLADEDNDLEDDIDNLGDDLSEMLAFTPYIGDNLNDDYKLNSKLNLAIKYPFLLDKMSIGVLYSQRLNSDLDYYSKQITGIYTLIPCHWFSLSTSYTKLDKGYTIGGLIDITPNKGLNFFLGMELMSLNLTSDYIPLDELNLSLQTGISIAIGGNKYKK